MGSKYTTQTSATYNSNPPADDGTKTAANQLFWSTIKSKLGDPVKTLADAINTALVAVLDLSANAQSSAYNIALTDHWKTIEVTGTTTVKLPDAATATANFQVTVFNADASLTTTVGRTTAGDTINGTAADVTIPPKSARTFLVNSSTNGYDIVGVAGAVFTSSETTVTASAATTTVAHGLGVVPSHVSVVVRCKTQEFGYSVGDEVIIASSNATSGESLWANATNLGHTMATSGAINIPNRINFATTTITSNNWKLVFRAWV